VDSAKGFFEQFPFPIPWIVSAALALGATAITLLPSIVELAGLLTRGTRPPPTHFDAVWEAIWLVALILIAGYVLEALSTPMYKLLEGYRLWPKWLNGRRRRAHVARLNRLQQEHENSTAFDRAAVEEKLDEYPVGEDRVAATRLGNVMRAMETYGKDHYGLDSQLLWYELTTVAPQPLQMELIRSRQSADFFVSTLFTSILFAAAAILTGFLENVTGLSEQNGVLSFGVKSAGQASMGPFYFGVTPMRIGLGSAHILLGLIVLAVIPGCCYRMAIEMIKLWAGVIQALVNIGRIQLASHLNLILPDAHKAERDMWDALCEFVGGRKAKEIEGWALQLDSLKVKRNPIDAVSQPSSGEDNLD
jgi:hypothetical protein